MYGFKRVIVYLKRNLNLESLFRDIVLKVECRSNNEMRNPLFVSRTCALEGCLVLTLPGRKELHILMQL